MESNSPSLHQTQGGSVVTQPGAESDSPTFAPPVAQPALVVASGPPLARLLAALGAIAIVIGSVTPWASVSASSMSVSINGTDGDGVFTLVGGIVLLGLLFVGKYVGGIIVGVITGGILMADLGSVSDLVEGGEFVTVAVGWGLYLATAGAVVAVVSFIVLKRNESTRATAE